MLDPPERAALLSVNDADEVHAGFGAAGCNVTRGGSGAGFVDALAVRMVHLHIRTRCDAGNLKGVGTRVWENLRIDKAPVGIEDIGAVAAIYP